MLVIVTKYRELTDDERKLDKTGWNYTYDKVLDVIELSEDHPCYMIVYGSKVKSFVDDPIYKIYGGHISYWNFDYLEEKSKSYTGILGSSRNITQEMVSESKIIIREKRFKKLFKD